MLLLHTFFLYSIPLVLPVHFLCGMFTRKFTPPRFPADSAGHLPVNQCFCSDFILSHFMENVYISQFFYQILIFIVYFCTMFCRISSCQTQHHGAAEYKRIHIAYQDCRRQQQRQIIGCRKKRRYQHFILFPVQKKSDVQEIGRAHV